MANELIIRKMNEISISDLTPEELIQLKDQVIDNVNIKQLKEAVNKACINLSNVGEPTWNADIEFIADDNQKRLNIICLLLQNLNLFESYTSNMKKNKYGCADDIEKVYSYISTTKELIDTVVKYGEFKQQEYIDTIKQIEENNKKYLKEGEE